jgi:acyl carrier protein
LLPSASDAGGPPVLGGILEIEAEQDSAMSGFSNRDEVTQGVIAVVNQTIRDWDVDLPDGVTSETCLMRDLNFESIDVVQFAVAIEQAAGRKGLPFEKLLMRDGGYVDDVKLNEVVDFLCDELGIRS